MSQTPEVAAPLPPPYQMTGADHVQIGVIWDSSVASVLPGNLRAAKEMTGGINIYQVAQGRVIGPYQSAYLWLDLEGFDSPEGYKGRWMLAGVYGPEAKTSEALRAYYGLPVRCGTSRFETTPKRRRAIGSLDGQDIIKTEIIPSSDDYVWAAVLLNYVSLSPDTGGVIVNHIPVVAEVRPAQPVSVDISAPARDPFAGHAIARLDWGLEVRNGSFSFSLPRAM